MNSSSSTGELAHGYFGAAAEVDQASIEPVAGRAPLVFFDQRARVDAEAQVLLAQAVELHDDRLGKRGQRDGYARRRGHIADAELQRAERRVRPQVPPHFLRVVDAVELDEGLQVVLVLAPRVELIRNARAGKPPEDGRSIGFQAGVTSLPERRAGREREQVRQEVARLVEQLDGPGAIGRGDVNMQAEDEQRSGQLLQFFDDVFVALAGRDHLIHPARKRMSAGCRDSQPDALRTLGKIPPDFVDLRLELVDVGADFGADFDDRLMHLALQLIAKRRGARGEQLGNVRSQLPRIGVDDLEFFLNADGKRVIHRFES